MSSPYARAYIRNRTGSEPVAERIGLDGTSLADTVTAQPAWGGDTLGPYTVMAPLPSSNRPASRSAEKWNSSRLQGLDGKVLVTVQHVPRDVGTSIGNLLSNYLATLEHFTVYGKKGTWQNFGVDVYIDGRDYHIDGADQDAWRQVLLAPGMRLGIFVQQYGPAASPIEAQLLAQKMADGFRNPEDRHYDGFIPRGAMLPALGKLRPDQEGKLAGLLASKPEPIKWLRMVKPAYAGKFQPRPNERFNESFDVRQLNREPGSSLLVVYQDWGKAEIIRDMHSQLTKIVQDAGRLR